MQTKYRERLLHLESTFMDTIPSALNSVYTAFLFDKTCRITDAWYYIIP
jgi:hypothetical protein